jgi:ABC-type multidrug transport system fused ATPase/permease subunit
MRKLLPLLKDMLQLLLAYPGWLVAAIASTILVSAAEPSLAWFGKTVIDDFKKGRVDLQESLLRYVLSLGGLLLGLGILKFSDKLIDKVYEVRLILKLQQTYLDRRTSQDEAIDISRILYDCNRAKPGLDILHRDSWKIISQTISVVVWQLTLAPAWLPALLIAVVPPTLVGFLFGPYVQRISHNLLRTQGNLAACTQPERRAEFTAHQESFFRHTLRMEILKALSGNLMDLLTWIGLLILILLSGVLPALGLIPKQVEAGDLALFYVNLGLLSKPLNEIVKVYNKAQESYPALVRVLQPSKEEAKIL